MSGPPPGYNPSDSLFQGGDAAQIRPVMGGGGAAPPGYSPDTSLFQGGDSAQIQPVMGGGAVPGSRVRWANLEAAEATETVEAVPSLSDAMSRLVAAQKIVKELEKQVAKTQETFDGMVSTDPKRSDAAVSLATLKAELSKAEAQRDLAEADVTMLTVDPSDPAAKAAAAALPPPSQDQNAYVEYYKVASEPNSPFVNFSQNLLTGIMTDPFFVSVLPPMVKDYVENRRPQWQRAQKPASRGTLEPTMSSSASSMITSERCQKTGTFTPVGQTGFHRLAIVLPESTRTIILVPPIKGRLDVLDNCLAAAARYGYLTKNSAGNPILSENVKLIFSAPYYAPLTDERSDNPTLAANYVLFYVFLLLEKYNRGNVFALAQHTQENIVLGCMLNRFPKPEQALPADQPLLNMMEPTYVVYPYKRGRKNGLLFTAATEEEAPIPKSKVGSFYSISDLLESGIRSKYSGLAIMPDHKTPDPGIGGYVTYRSVGSPDRRMTVPRVMQPRAGGPCENLYSSININDNTSDEQWVAPVEATIASPAVDNADMLLIFRVAMSQREMEYRTSCERAAETETKIGVQRLRTFYPSDESTVAVKNVPVVQVPLGGKVYEIRSSGTAYADWVKQIYTPSETEFLNDLNLRPYILDDIFPLSESMGVQDSRTWQEWVALFLKNVTTSRCFDDKVLLTRRECEDARTFVNAVYNYFLANDDRLGALSAFDAKAEENVEMMLRERKWREEMERIKAAEAAQARVDEQSKLDPDVEIKAGNMVVLGTGEFATGKKWGDARATYEAPGATDDLGYYMTPLLIVERKTGRYKLRALRIPKSAGLSKEQVRDTMDDLLVSFQAKYPGWNFLM